MTLHTALTYIHDIITYSPNLYPWRQINKAQTALYNVVIHTGPDYVKGCGVVVHTGPDLYLVSFCLILDC